MKNKIIIIFVALAAVAAIVVFVVLPSVTGENPDKLYSYSAGDVFVTNVKDSNHLLKTAIVLVLDTDTLAERLDEENYKIRDTLVFLLRELDMDTLNSVNVRDTLREQIIRTLNGQMGIDNIVDVNFPDFVWQ
jgi:flagellar basal body-associated protein FliL